MAAIAGLQLAEARSLELLQGLCVGSRSLSIWAVCTAFPGALAGSHVRVGAAGTGVSAHRVSSDADDGLACCAAMPAHTSNLHDRPVIIVGL